jgi:hypothetical protein
MAYYCAVSQYANAAYQIPLPQAPDRSFAIGIRKDEALSRAI